MGSKRETTKSENARGSETSRQICLMCVRTPNSKRLSKLVTHTNTHTNTRVTDSRMDGQTVWQILNWRFDVVAFVDFENLDAHLDSSSRRAASSGICTSCRNAL